MNISPSRHRGADRGRKPGELKVLVPNTALRTAPIEASQHLPGIDVLALAELLPTASGSDVVLLDVREQDEWDAGHVASAIHLPLRLLNPHTAPLDTEGTGHTAQALFVISRRDSRATAAADLLANVGVSAVRVAGGVLAWVTAGLTVVDSHGQPGRII